MATQPTNLPVPSETPRDLKFNAGKIDEFVTGDNHTYTDRFGQKHRTIAGLNYDANQAMLNYGYITKKSFEQGATLDTPNTILQLESNGEFYRWDGDWTQPKVVPPGSTPESAGGIGPGKWVGVGDAALRSDLSDLDGASLVGEGSYTDIRAYNGSGTKIRCLGRAAIGDGGEGFFVRDDADTATADNGGTVLVDAAGHRWKREYQGAIYTCWFAEGNGIADDTVPLKNAIIESASKAKRLIWSAGTYLANRIKVSGDKYVYDWEALGKVILKSTASSPLGPEWIDDYFVRIEGGAATAIDYNTTINPGDTSVSISSAYTLEIDDVLMIQGNRLIQTDNRGQACEGEMHLVKSFNAVTRKAELTGASYFFYSSSSDYTAVVTAAASAGEFSFAGDTTLTAQYNQVKVTGITGANAGISRYITHWDNVTKTAKFEYVQGPFPSVPAIGDTFKVTRKADMYKRKPCYGRIVGDFHFVRPVTYNAVAGDLGFRGLVIDGAVDMHIEGITVSGFSETGIFLESCYRTTLLNIYTEYANRGYNLTDGTGYGVEVYNCSYCTVENLVAFACRRGLDVSGTQMVSLYNNVINPVAMGGGVAYDGVKFFPGGDTRNSCCGGHGPSYETSFIGGNSINQYYAAVIRGLNEIYDGLMSRGLSGPAIFFIRYSGGGFTIQNCNYIDGFTEASLPSSLRYKPVPAPQRDKRPLAFIDMTLAQTDRNSYYKELPVVIKGNTARTVTKGFIRFEVNDGLTPLIQNIYFGGNLCIANPETSTSATGLTEAVMVYASVPNAKIVRNFHDLGGNRIISTGAGYTSCGMYSTPDGIAGVIVQPDGRYLITIDPGKSVGVLVSGYVPNIRLSLHDILRLQYSASAVGVMLHRGEAIDYSPLKDINKQYLALQTGALTDGSGDDGKLNVSFDVATVYFSNRLPNKITLAVDIAGI